jgi:ABC-type branched-subunit amino acid transport system ATPase component
MNVLLEVIDAKVHFGGVKAVDGVNLELKSGTLYGLVGPNGSGKSTLLGALSRMTDLTEGTLTFSGEEYQSHSAARTARMGIGRTFQAVRLLPELSVLENVMLGGDARLYGCGIVANWLMPWRTRACERNCRQAAQSAIERLDLGGFEKRKAGMLPYGVQRRVEIARALAGEPTLLLFDEPTAGMNREERDEIGQVMRDLRGEGLTQILVEHDMQMITEVCDYVHVMNFGKVIAEGDPSVVVSNPLVQEAYLGKRGEARATA